MKRLDRWGWAAGKDENTTEKSKKGKSRLKSPKWTMCVSLLILGLCIIVIIYFLHAFVMWSTIETTPIESLHTETQENAAVFNAATMILSLPCFMAAIILTLRNLYRMARRHDRNIRDE